MVARKPTAETDSKRAQKKDEPSEMQEAVSALETPHRRIAERAYRLYMDRGAEDGHALEDWLRAEQEVLGERPTRAVPGQS